MFVVDPMTPLGPEVWTAKPKVAMVLKMRSVGAIRLDEPLPLTGIDWGGAKLKTPLTAGDVMTATGLSKGLYCAPQRLTFLPFKAPCLRDRDGDGQFDESLSSFFVGYGPQGTLITDQQRLLPVSFSESARLPKPVRYTAAALEQSPSLEAKLRWRKVSYPKEPGSPTLLTFWLDGTVDSPLDGDWDARHGFGSFSAEQSVVLGRDDDRIRFGGLTILVLGFDKHGQVQFQLEDYEPDQPVPLYYRSPPASLTLYI
jgi:hypothetical protein